MFTCVSGNNNIYNYNNNNYYYYYLCFLLSCCYLICFYCFYFHTRFNKCLSFLDVGWVNIVFLLCTLAAIIFLVIIDFNSFPKPLKLIFSFAGLCNYSEL